ncbi:hypothetical protein AB837_00390 [bacterium AB1]|nr:hypothetical protein AB837_00390 [bacterium AB1]
MKRSLYSLCKMSQEVRDTLCKSILPEQPKIEYSVGSKVEVKYLVKNIKFKDIGIVTKITGRKYFRFVEIIYKNNHRMILPTFDNQIQIKEISKAPRTMRRAKLTYLYNSVSLKKI